MYQKELRLVKVIVSSLQMIFGFDRSGLPSGELDIRTSWFARGIFWEEPGELLLDFGFGVLLTAALRKVADESQTSLIIYSVATWFIHCVLLIAPTVMGQLFYIFSN